MGKLCELDDNKAFERIVWQAFPKAIRLLLNNPYVFNSFWAYQRGDITEAQWQERFENGKAAANAALGNQDTATLLAIVFNRIYTLRNQLLHGGATFGSSVNRGQLCDCV